jgi:hypothetical protein
MRLFVFALVDFLEYGDITSFPPRQSRFDR